VRRHGDDGVASAHPWRDDRNRLSSGVFGATNNVSGGRQALDDPQHFSDEFGIESGRDFIAEENRWLHGECASDGDALLLSARQTIWHGVEFVGKPDAGQ